MRQPFALYVHVPWCRHVCPYCDFNVQAAATAPEGPFVAAIARELDAHVAAPPWEGRPAGSVYLGGGTPSLLSPAAVGALLDAVRARCGLVPDAEVTLEANPGTVDGPWLAAWRAAGVNRLSLGAQSFRAALLRRLGRDHQPADTPAAVAAARAAGFRNLSLDLIYAVPGSTVADWEQDLDDAVALDPEHVSTYALTWEAGTPFQAWRERGRLVAVDDEVEAAMADAALVRLSRAGYERYEISSFARPGFAARHNARYWDGSEYLGLGPGAHSFAREPAPGRRWANEREPGRWEATVRARGTAVANEERLTPAQARGEFCFTGLRRTAGVDLGAFRRRFGVEARAAFPHLEGLVAEGLVEDRAGRLRLTARGLRFADTVAATFV